MNIFEIAGSIFVFIFIICPILYTIFNEYGFKVAFYSLILALVILDGMFYYAYLFSGSIILFDLFITIIIVGFPGVIWSLVVIFIINKYFSEMIFRRLRKRNKLSEIIILELEENKLIKKIDKKSINKHISFWPFLLYLLFPGVILLLFFNYFVNVLMNMFFEVGYLSHMFGLGLGHIYLDPFDMEGLASRSIALMNSWRNSSDFLTVLAFSSIVSILIFLKFRPIKKIKISLETKIDELSDELIFTNLFFIDIITEFENKMDKISNKLGCSMVHLYKNNIKKFIKNNNSKIINDNNCLNLKVEREIDNAKDDYNHLLQCYKNYQKTIDFANKTINIVNQTGRATFVNQMDYIIIEGIENKALKLLITKKKWADFNDILFEINESLKQLKKGAEDYLKASQKKESSSQNNEKEKSEEHSSKNYKENNNNKNEKFITLEDMSYKKALEIIGLPEGSSKKEILLVASQKVKTSHSDRYDKAPRKISKEKWNKKHQQFKIARKYLKSYYKD